MDHTAGVGGPADPPATLLFTQQPTDSLAGEVISPAVVVTAKNSKRI